MGQQQLLLIILGVIIVGIAIAVGLSLFSAQSVQSNRDAIINDLNNLAAQAYQYMIRPSSMGGGQGSYGGFSIPSKMVTNENATSLHRCDHGRIGRNDPRLHSDLSSEYNEHGHGEFGLSGSPEWLDLCRRLQVSSQQLSEFGSKKRPARAGCFFFVLASRPASPNATSGLGARLTDTLNCCIIRMVF